MRIAKGGLYFFKNNYKMIKKYYIWCKMWEKKLKILTPKQMLKRFPIALAQLKTDNTSESLLNKTSQIIYSLCQAT